MEPKEPTPEQLKTGHEYHVLAEQTRENGDFMQALEHTDRATVGYQKEGNIPGLAEVQSSRALTFRHLFEQSGEQNYLVFALHAAQAGVDVAKRGNIPELAVPVYNVAKVHETLGNNNDASALIKDSLKNLQDYPNQPQNRPSLVAEMKTRLASLEYRIGDESAIERFNQALEELKNSGEKDEYTFKVWVSGAYMHMGESLIGKDNEKARSFFDEGARIIGEDEKYKLRRNQIAKLLTRVV